MPYSISELKKPEIIKAGRELQIEYSESVRRIVPVGLSLSSQITIILLYIAFKYLESGIEEPLTYNLIVSNKLNFSPIIYNNLERITQLHCLGIVNRLIKKYNNPNHYASAIVSGLTDSRVLTASGAYMESGIGTPSSIAKLATRILDIRPNDYAADICCGRGDFMVTAALQNSDISFDGYEMNIPIIAIATIRADILGIKANFKIGDAIYNLADCDTKYDKVFSHFPFGQRHQGEDVSDRPYLRKARYYDWVFVDSICDHLSDNGKGVAIVSNGMLWNVLDKQAREHFINSGEIEAIIKLPERIFSPYSVAPTSILILSKNNNKIRFVDASKIISQSDYGIYDKKFSEADINKILNALKQDTKISFTVDRDTIIKNDFSLDIRQYNTDQTTYENGVKLKEVADIVRGVDDIRNDYGQATTQKGLQVLRLSDISDSIIPQKLTKLEENDFSEKYITLKNGDIIISRNPNPVKVALYNGDENRKVVPSGNLYVIRCDEDKIKPSYLMAFFLSNEGKNALDNIATGSFIRTIGMGSLENMIVPLANRERQIELEEEIRRTQMELYKLKTRLQEMQHRLHTLYEKKENN